MSENQTPAAEPKEVGGAKKFFTSKIFKWILIIVLELINLPIFAYVIGAMGDASASGSKGIEGFLTKQFLIYYGICIVLSIGVLAKMRNSIKKSQNSGKKGVIRVMTTQQYNEEQTDKFVNRSVFMIVLCLIVAPFAAPVSLGSLIHSILCKALG